MTILNQTTEFIQEGYTWGFNFSFVNIIIFILGILAIIVCIYFINDDDDPSFGMSFCLILGVAVVIGCFHSKPVYREVTQYEVIISEDTPFYDIYNNYDIIDQRGEIFILQEKS